MYLNKIKSLTCGLAFAAALFTVSAPLRAQTLTTGDVAGLITDASGAVVPNATITLKSTADNSTRTATSNGSGEYRFALLAGGEYTLSATAPGLKPSLRRLTVQIGQAMEVDIPLTVQGNAEVVEVTAEATILQTEDANLTTAYTAQHMVDLPTAGGDLTTLAMTVPGVRVNIQGGSGNMNANGVPGSSVLFTLNGADVMDPYNNLNNSGASNNLLGANEVSEAAVILNAFDAQYGRMAGGQENIISKSGANAFHGSALWNYNGQELDARDFFVALAGNRKTRSDSNQYGGLVSGPVKKNKVFFLFDTEGLRYVLPANSTITLPSPQLMNFALLNVPSSALPLYQDATKLYAGASGASTSTLVTNGTGPFQDSKNKLGCTTNGTFVGTVDPGVGTFGTTVPCAEVFVESNNQLNTEALYTVRADYNVNDKHRVFFRYNYDAGVQATSTSPINPAYSSVSTQPQHQGQMNYSWVISPSLVNNFIGAGSWYSAIFGVANETAALGLMPDRFSFSDGGSNSGGFTSVGTSGVPNGRNVGQMQLIDDLSWTKGKHNVKTGFNYRFNKVTATNTIASAIAGTYAFADLTDFAYGKVNSTGKGSQFTESYPLLQADHIRASSLNFYVQDEWALKPNLKLTTGIRFERDGNPGCTDNCFARLNQQFGTSGYQGGASIPYNATITTGLHNAYGSLEAIITEPRVSLAYSPYGAGKTVIRGGVGLFANLFAASVANNIDTNAPEVFSPTVTTGTVGTLTDPGTAASIALSSSQAFQSGFVKGYTLAQLQAGLPAGVKFATPGYYSPPNHFVAPKILQWNVQIEQPVWGHDVLSATYTGNHGYDEALTNGDANSFVSAGNTSYPNGYGGLPIGVAPDPRFLTVSQILTTGRSNYDALIVQYRHSFGHGLQGQIGETWSHTLGNVSVYNPYNINAGYGPLGFDTRHQIVADLVYNTPKFNNRAMDLILHNWTLGNKFYFQTGPPFSATNSAISAKINSAGGIGNTILADVVVPSAINSNCSASITGTTPCLTPSQFAATASQFDFGNVAPNQFKGPGYVDLDTQLMRTIPIKERFKLAIGMQFYNVFNHPNFKNPSGSVTSSALGFISSTAVPPTSIYGSFQSGTTSGRVGVLAITLRF